MSSYVDDDGSADRSAHAPGPYNTGLGGRVYSAGNADARAISIFYVVELYIIIMTICNKTAESYNICST